MKRPYRPAGPSAYSPGSLSDQEVGRQAGNEPVKQSDRPDGRYDLLAVVVVYAPHPSVGCVAAQSAVAVFVDDNRHPSSFEQPRIRAMPFPLSVRRLGDVSRNFKQSRTSREEGGQAGRDEGPVPKLNEEKRRTKRPVYVFKEPKVAVVVMSVGVIDIDIDVVFYGRRSDE
ncbi:Hypothetical predicted protein [Olea europaea subsp. europaea]|uniref:Uncharacterized protein n=1 Tax=Olea europaea subsp. europaea TaxID=158383 RepID=A0A8S0VKK3_OLEEU|nr:Hypothetical predicted protein [Olea europaea subsp. europaea]